MSDSRRAMRIVAAPLAAGMMSRTCIRTSSLARPNVSYATATTARWRRSRSDRRGRWRRATVTCSRLNGAACTSSYLAEYCAAPLYFQTCRKNRPGGKVDYGKVHWPGHLSRAERRPSPPAGRAGRYLLAGTQAGGRVRSAPLQSRRPGRYFTGRSA
jgi:hypothetical protein